MSQQIYTMVSSPVGELLLGGDGETLSRLWFTGPGTKTLGGIDPEWTEDPTAYEAVRAQLDEYFAGERRQFELRLELHGTEWERRVWDALLEIPYGETRSYGEIAQAIGASGSRSARAVGLANGRNPVAVIVPCHRVIGADGSLTGYGGGLPRKRLLLDLEAGTPALIPEYTY